MLVTRADVVGDQSAILLASVTQIYFSTLMLPERIRSKEDEWGFHKSSLVVMFCYIFDLHIRPPVLY